MQFLDGRVASKHAGRPRRSFAGQPHRVLLVGVIPAAWLLAGCGSGGDLISSVALPSHQATHHTAGVDVAVSPSDDRQSGAMALTPVQQEYLDALAAAGVRPSSDLRALSIGAYVCQARAAGQSEQAVWDSVAPMVRSDIADARAAAPQTAAAPDPDAVVGQYMTLASQRLC